MKPPKHEIKKLKAGHAEGITFYSAMPKRVAGFFQGDDSTLHPSIRGHVALFRAILIQQLMDAKSRRTKKEYEYLRTSANNWLFGNQEDFRMVCDLAGWDPDVMREKLTKARDNGYQRNDRVRLQATKEIREDQREQRKQRQSRKKLQELGLYPTPDTIAPRRKRMCKVKRQLELAF